MRKEKKTKPFGQNYFVPFGIFHWGLLDRKVEIGSQFITYCQNVCQKKINYSFLQGVTSHVCMLLAPTLASVIWIFNSLENN